MGSFASDSDNTHLTYCPTKHVLDSRAPALLLKTHITYLYSSATKREANLTPCLRFDLKNFML